MTSVGYLYLQVSLFCLFELAQIIVSATHVDVSTDIIVLDPKKMSNSSNKLQVNEYKSDLT
jgi:hypothetical protein